MRLVLFRRTRPRIGHDPLHLSSGYIDIQALRLWVADDALDGAPSELLAWPTTVWSLDFRGFTGRRLKGEAEAPFQSSSKYAELSIMQQSVSDSERGPRNGRRCI